MGDKKAFLALISAGLWEKETWLAKDVDFDAVFQMAQTQSVTGLLTAGCEKLSVYRLPLTEKLKLVGMCQLIEQRNLAMNSFIARTIVQMRDAGIKPLLVKGQGISQCYMRPLWRASGDIDFFFSKEDFPKAVELLKPLAAAKVQDAKYTKSYGLTIDGWFVELHGTLRNSLSSRMDKVIDEVQEDTFQNRRVRTWFCGDTEILMPDANNDLFLLFTHFVRHFYKGGFALRQLCDWCRLMWTYQDEIDSSLLESRLHKAGLMTEWKAFAAVAVDNLGMLKEAVPLYDADKRWQEKGEAVLRFILKGSKPNKVKDTLAIAKIFPWNTLCFAPSIFLNVNRLKVKERINNNGLLHSCWGWDSQ